MGNGIGRLNLCFAGDAGEISRRRHHHDIAVYLSDPLVDDGLGHSFCYIGPDPSSKLDRTISGASISANTSTPLSTALLIRYNNSFFDKAASFESSDSFASIPLQPIPKTSVRSGPIPTSGFLNSGPMGERGFLSGPIERSFISGPLEVQNYHHYDHLQRYKPKSKKFALMKILRRRKDKDKSSSSPGAWMVNGSSDHQNRPLEINNLSLSSTEGMSIAEHTREDEEEEEEEEEDYANNELQINHLLHQQPVVQWAQGKAGEDRVHVVISEEYGWDFVGIYDGFNGPDATDFLLNNLYSNVHNELKGISSPNNPTTDQSSANYHSEVLRALSEALKKTERAYLEIANMMLDENPELALMGSCVLAMLMKGDDVYLMNVGDSRAVLARRPEHFNGDELVDAFPSFDTFQITMDHSTSVDEEVRRIRSEHRDDPYAVINGRVKGSLKVTRAFGAGFLKQPKWNNALLEMFRIDYVGTSPYITCSPSLYHHKLGPRDKFLILSSDGLYQYFTNEEAVAEVEAFVASFPEGDPAQHLVEEVLFRAAKKAGMAFHDLLDIPQGDRRKYHDDVSVIIISFEGRIWRSSL